MEDLKLTPSMEEELSNGRGDPDDDKRPREEKLDKPEH